MINLTLLIKPIKFKMEEVQKVIETSASFVYIYFIDKLIEAIATGFIKVKDTFFNFRGYFSDISCFFTFQLDIEFMKSLLKGFMLGNLVIFAMCYLDWHWKRRLHHIDVNNKVSKIINFNSYFRSKLFKRSLKR